MESGDIARVRKVLLAATVVVFAALIALVAAAVSPQEDWIEYSVESPEYGLEREGYGVYATVSCAVTVTSHMHFDVDKIDLKVYLVDGDSRELVATVEDETIEADGTATVDISSRFSLLTGLSEVYKIVEDGEPLHLQVEATCSYLLGLASLTATTDVYVPITEEGGMSIAVTENTSTDFEADISGLKEWIVPDDRDLTITGGGYTLNASVHYADGVLSVSMSSESDLKEATMAMSSAEDLSAVDSEGVVVSVSGNMMLAMYLVLWYYQSEGSS